VNGPAHRFGATCAIAFSVIVWAPSASAASLKQETVNAWDEYVHAAGVRLQHRLDGDDAFLWTDQTPDRARRVLRKEIVVAPASPDIPLAVPSGLVHDWLGAAFIPNVSIHDVLLILRDYDRYGEFYSPNVVDSRAIASGEAMDRFSVVLRNKSVFSRIALENEYQTTYIHIDHQRLYSLSHTTRIHEIADYGTSGQHTLPQDEGTGLIWRAYSVTRMEERDGGVHIEMDVMVLSRDIPPAIRWFVGPLVRRASREYLTTTIRQTRDAVEGSLAARGPGHVSVLESAQFQQSDQGTKQKRLFLKQH
jgi:hypothetical protein